MIVSFFESIKYVGHLFPITFLRIYVGYFYAKEAYAAYYGDFLTQPRLAAQVNEWLPKHQVPELYKNFFEKVVVTQWQAFAYLVDFIYIVVAVSFITGFLVRPVAIIAIILSWHFLYISSPDQATAHQLLIVLCLTLCWVGAGRCLGFDYHFYKRRRGLLW